MMHGGMGGGMHGGGPGRGMGHLEGSRRPEIEQLGVLYDHAVVTRLLGYLAPHKRRVAIAAGAMLVFSFSSSIGPYLIATAIDRYIGVGDLGGLSFIAAIFVINSLMLWGASWAQQISMAYVGQNVLYTLRTQAFNHLQRLSLSFFDRNEVGIVMSRVQNDILVMQELLTNGFLTIVEDVLMLGVVVVIMLRMNARMAAITLVVMPVLVLLMSIWQRYARVAFTRVRQAIANVNAGLQENISGVRVIQSLNREDRNLIEFDRTNEAHLNANLQAERVAAGVFPVVEVLAAISTALVLYFGGRQVLGHTMRVGELIAFTLYISRLFEPIRMLVMQYTELQRAMTGGQRIFEVLDVKPEIVDRANATDLESVEGEVVFRNVSFSYEPGVEVLHDINLDIRAGEAVAFVGATGAGKTTLVNLLARFYEVHDGQITIDGHDIREVTRESLTRQIGIVLQDPFLFSASIRDNIRYGRLEATDEEVEAAAKIVGADDFVQRLPEKYDTQIGERGGNLSAGQRQLISFARAVLADPRILVLDEATATVDTQTEMVIQRALGQLLQGRTSLVIAHRLSTIRNADKVVVLDKGRMVEMGTHDELMALGGIYANLYKMTYAQLAKEDEKRKQVVT